MSTRSKMTSTATNITSTHQHCKVETLTWSHVYWESYTSFITLLCKQYLHCKTCNMTDLFKFWWLTHLVFDFTLLEALASWTLAWDVAPAEASIFEWMSSARITLNMNKKNNKCCVETRSKQHEFPYLQW